MTVTDTLPGREVDFTIGDPFWVMQALADLYSNRELATIRELSTNGRDANDEAGNSDPIEVTLPTFLDPYFVVKDAGVGMSVDELEEVYSSFGVSTKRKNVKSNGMLGFGSKAPIAYTGTFSVTSVKDGIKSHAQVIKKEDRIVLKVVMSHKTDEPNGTTVKVPVHNQDKFCHIARDFYRYWLPGTVLVDGLEPKQAVGEKIDDNLYYSTEAGTSYVVMANVPYRINNPAALFKSSGLKNVSFVAYVPAGSVEFTPNREDLKYTDHTINSLQSVISDFENKMISESRAQIEKAETHAQAWAIHRQWVDRLGEELFRDIEYKGEKIPVRLSVKATRYTYAPKGSYSYSRYNTQRVEHVTVSALRDMIVVKNFYPANLGSHHKGDARIWAEAHVSSPRSTYLFVEDDWTTPWVDSKRFVYWDDIKEYKKSLRPKIEREKRPSRPKGLFDYLTKDGWHGAKPLPADGQLYYTTLAENRSYSLQQALRLTNDSGTIILLAKNRVEKFKRDNPKAVDYVPYIKSKVVLDGNSLLSDKAKKALGIASRTKQWLERLDVDQIADPEFAATKALIAPNAEWLKEYTFHWELAGALNMRYQFKSHTIDRDDSSLIEKYPLLDEVRFYSVDKDELYIYINAKYASMKGKK